MYCMFVELTVIRIPLGLYREIFSSSRVRINDDRDVPRMRVVHFITPVWVGETKKKDKASTSLCVLNLASSTESLKGPWAKGSGRMLEVPRRKTPQEWKHTSVKLLAPLWDVYVKQALTRAAENPLTRITPPPGFVSFFFFFHKATMRVLLSMWIDPRAQLSGYNAQLAIIPLLGW